MTLKTPSPGERSTLKTINAPGVVRQSTSAPGSTNGQDGDWWIRDQGGLDTARTTPPVMYGPKAAGAWSTEWKRVMPNAARYMSDAKSVSSDGIGPVALGLTVLENINAAPVANPFTAVKNSLGGTWTTTGSAFYNNARAGWCSAVLSSIGTASFSGPPPLTQLGYVKVTALPSATDGTASAVAVGSIHADASAYGYLAWADSSGRLCIGKFQSLGSTGATAYLTATGTGVVTANRYIAFLRIGTLFQAFVFDSNGIIVANTTLQVLMDGSFDGTFATGSGVVAYKTQDARLSNFYGLV